MDYVNTGGGGGGGGGVYKGPVAQGIGINEMEGGSAISIACAERSEDE